MNTPEAFEAPKQIAAKLCEVHGLCFSISYIRAIRRESIARGDCLFAGGMAQPSAVFTWIKSHPEFRRRGAKKPLSAGLM